MKKIVNDIFNDEKHKTNCWLVSMLIACVTCLIFAFLVSPFLNFANIDTAYAEQKSVDAIGTFHQKLVSTYDQPMEQTYNYEFIASDSQNPMPEGSVGNRYTFSMTGNTDFVTKISYTQPGTYLYKCNLITPNPELENYVYDKTVITVKVEIVLKPTGELVNNTYFSNETGEKTFDAEWTHTFNGKRSEQDESLWELLSKLTKTSDATLPVTILGICLLLVAGVLFLVYNGASKKQNKSKD